MPEAASLPDIQLYPLTFRPIYKAKVWGGDAMTTLGRSLPDTPEGEGIGESWELADLATTAKSGGGGNPEHSVVRHGPLAGKRLHDLCVAYGSGVMGGLDFNKATDGFPLLLKFLDANANLSVQVHPSPEYAEQHDDAYLKSEAWYIVDARPGAVIYKGIKEGVTPEQLRAALEANTDEAVVPLMVTVPVEPGDCHYLPSGTCHALGAGVLVAEVQTPSDTTFRVYDWGRVGRELHVDQAIACIRFAPPDVAEYEKRVHMNTKHGEVERLVLCEHFRIDRVRCDAGAEEAITGDQPIVWMVLDGGGTLTCNADHDGAEVAFTRGDTVFVPPGAENVRFTVGDGGATWLEVSFPQAGAVRLA